MSSVIRMRQTPNHLEVDIKFSRNGFPHCKGLLIKDPEELFCEYNMKGRTECAAENSVGRTCGCNVGKILFDYINLNKYLTYFLNELHKG